MRMAVGAAHAPPTPSLPRTRTPHDAARSGALTVPHGAATRGALVALRATTAGRYALHLSVNGERVGDSPYAFTVSKVTAASL